MRISTAAILRNSQSFLMHSQYNVATAQQQVSSGKAYNRASDDPLSASKALNFKNAIDTLETYGQQIDVAENRLNLAETVITRVLDITQGLEQSVKQALSDTFSNENRIAIGKDLETQLSGLLGLANTKDEKGEYLFSGYQGTQVPYTKVGNSIIYNGDQGQRLLQVGPSTYIPISDPGAQLFDYVKSGNGDFITTTGPTANTGSGVISIGSVTDRTAYTPETYTISFVTNASSNLAYQVFGSVSGQLIPALPGAVPADAPDYVSGADIMFNGITVDIQGEPNVGDDFQIIPSQNQSLFTTIQNIIDVLLNPPNNATEAAEFKTALLGQAESLAQNSTHLVNKLTEVGSRGRALDSERSVHNDLIDQNLMSLSNVEDADPYKAISALSREMTALQTAQQTYALLQKLSLFNFLG